MQNWPDISEYPFTSHYFQTGNNRLHYIDEGSGEVILFVHGTPSWSFDYRHIIRNLKPHYRCIAIDHIGFGQSDKPQHFDYSLDNHVAHLEKFILEKGLDHINLVVHDFGGPIALKFAILYPQKIHKIIIMNSWMRSSENEPEFKKFKRWFDNPLTPFLYKYFNFSARFLLPMSFGRKKITKTILKQYTSAFPTRKQRSGPLGFFYALLHQQSWFEEIWEQRKSISKKPVLLIWGMADPALQPKLIDSFQEGFVNIQIVKLEGCGHFPQEEEPVLVTEAILKFLHSED